MTRDQKEKILKRIVEIEQDVAELKKARKDLMSNGYASATLTSAGGSKSYTRTDSAKITDTINELIQELKKLRSLLAGTSTALPSQIIRVYM